MNDCEWESMNLMAQQVQQIRLGLILKIIHEDIAMTCRVSGLAPTFDNFVSSFLVGELGAEMPYDLYGSICMAQNVEKRSIKMAQKHTAPNNIQQHRTASGGIRRHLAL